MIKKVNALCTWLVTLCLLGHLGTMSYSMMTGWYNYPICKGLAKLTGLTVAIHVALTLIIFFFLQDGTSVKRYRKRNASTIIQRATGLIIVAVLHLHVKAFGFIAAGTPLPTSAKAGILVTELIFFGAIFAHLAVSFSKSMITLGLIRSDETEALVNKIMYVICGLLMCITTFALTSFVVAWTGFGA